MAVDTEKVWNGDRNRYSDVPVEHPSDNEVSLTFIYKTPYSYQYDEDWNRVNEQEGEEFLHRVRINVNGRSMGSFPEGPGDDEVNAAVEQYEADVAEYEAAVARTSPHAAMRDTAPGQPLGVEDAEVGQVAWVHGKGKWRQGVVSKVGRSRVHVEYYVVSSGTVNEKAGTAKQPVHVE